MKTKSEIFKQAHALAKTFEGNYMACFAEALRIVYYDMKKTANCDLSSELVGYLKLNLKSKLMGNNEMLYTAFLKDFEKAEKISEYAYKYWKVPFEGYQMFFNESFINQINK